MRFRAKIGKHIPTILSILASCGVVGTAVVAVLKTPEAMKRLEEAKKDRLTKTETFMVVAPVYLPAVGIGVGTIGCILGANALNKRSQASLISAIALADRSFKEYRSKVINMRGEDADKEIIKEIAKDHLKDVELEEPLYDDEALFYESYSEQYFTSKFKNVREAAYHINRNLAIKSYVTFNEYLSFLDAKKKEIPGGNEIGWDIAEGWDMYGYTWIDFRYDKTTLDDGMECWIISYPFMPHGLWEEYETL